MDLDRPTYSLVQGIDGISDLRSAALSELVGSVAQEKSIGGILSVFRYTNSYDELVAVLKARLPGHLLQWGSVHSHSTRGPMIQSSAMRLERGYSFWIAADTVVVLVPVTATPLRAELLGRDGTVIPIGIEPADLIVLNDTGVRVTGGHFRFIMMAWLADPPTGIAAHFHTQPVIHNLPVNGWITLGP